MTLPHFRWKQIKYEKKMKDYNWKQKSDMLDNQIEELFEMNDCYSKEIILMRVQAYAFTELNKNIKKDGKLL